MGGYCLSKSPAGGSGDGLGRCVVDRGASASADRATAAEPIVSALLDGIPSAVAVGVTGTQRGLTNAQKETACSVMIGLREGGAIWQHNGDCIGADAYAGGVWRFLGGQLHLHPPTTTAKRAFLKAHRENEPRPYLDRNSDIAAAVDILLALPGEMHEELRSGTWSTVRRARKLGKPIIFVWPNGRSSIEWLAQGMAARSGETGTGSTEGNSPVGSADAPPTPDPLT